MSQTNPQLVEYGIRTEQSDYRIHVSFCNGKAYAFPTENGRKAINPDKHKEFQAGQPGVSYITGIGYKVPWTDIDDCQEIGVPDDVLRHASFQKEAPTTEKGQKAMIVACELLQRGMVQMPMRACVITEKDLQIRGQDLIVTSRLVIQVKCDYWAGLYGLSMQTAERNPLGRH